MAVTRTRKPVTVDQALATLQSAATILEGAAMSAARMKRAETDVAAALIALSLEACPLEHGAALCTLAAINERQTSSGDMAAAERAVLCLTQALRVFSPGGFPALHTDLQRRLAVALRSSGDSSGDVVRALESAVSAQPAEADPSARAGLRLELATATMSWLQREGEATVGATDALVRATRALIDAIEIWDRISDWPNLTAAFLTLGDACVFASAADTEGGGDGALSRAADAYRRAAQTAFKANDRPAFARAQLNLGGVLLQRMDSDSSRRREIEQALDLAGGIFTAEAFPAQHQAVLRNRAISARRFATADGGT